MQQVRIAVCDKGRLFFDIVYSWRIQERLVARYNAPCSSRVRRAIAIPMESSRVGDAGGWWTAGS